MIHELSGDILLTKADMLAHGVAPGDDFKNGLALALREAFPSLYKDFRHFCKVRTPKPGTLWLWQGVDQLGRHVRIANLFTQEPPPHAGGHPGKAHTEYVNKALHQLKKLITDEGLKTVALPRLATGVGGLDWAHVGPLVRDQLGEVDAQVAVYTTYQPGVQAAEPFAENSAS